MNKSVKQLLIHTYSIQCSIFYPTTMNFYNQYINYIFIPFYYYCSIKKTKKK